jgi:hypothetical protein
MSSILPNEVLPMEVDNDAIGNRTLDPLASTVLYDNPIADPESIEVLADDVNPKANDGKAVDSNVVALANDPLADPKQSTTHPVDVCTHSRPIDALDTIFPILRATGCPPLHYVQKIVAFCRFLIHGYVVVHELLTISLLPYAINEFINHALVHPYLLLISIIYNELVYDLVNIFTTELNLKKEYMAAFTEMRGQLRTKSINQNMVCQPVDNPLQFKIKLLALPKPPLNFFHRHKQLLEDYRCLVHAVDFMMTNMHRLETINAKQSHYSEKKKVLIKFTQLSFYFCNNPIVSELFYQIFTDRVEVQPPSHKQHVPALNCVLITFQTIMHQFIAPKLFRNLPDIFHHDFLENYNVGIKDQRSPCKAERDFQLEIGASTVHDAFEFVPYFDGNEKINLDTCDLKLGSINRDALLKVKITFDKIKQLSNLCTDMVKNGSDNNKMMGHPGKTVRLENQKGH